MVWQSEHQEEEQAGKKPEANKKLSKQNSYGPNYPVHSEFEPLASGRCYRLPMANIWEYNLRKTLWPRIRIALIG